MIANWPKTAAGLPSTAGCTATILFIKKSKAYVGKNLSNFNQ